MTTTPGLPPGLLLLERGWLSANNILLIGPDDTAMVDSGYCTHAPQTLALVEAALEGRPLDQLLNTHLHSDHCGGNAALQQRFPNLRTRIPPGEALSVAHWDEEALSFRPTGQQCPRFNFQGLLESGTTLRLAGRAWEVHSAPGHDPHSIILFEPVWRTLLSADALWEKGFGVVFPELIGEASFECVAATLDLIERLSPSTVIPGHGRAFTDVVEALRFARGRLAGQVADPSRHARHALKVLIKFKLMEVQSISRTEWTQWIHETSYFELIRARFFDHEALEEISEDLLAALVLSRAAAMVGDRIENR